MKQVIEGLFLFLLGAAFVFAVWQIDEATKIEKQKARDAHYANVWKDCYDDDRYFAFQAYRGQETWCLKLSKGPMGIWSAKEVP